MSCICPVHKTHMFQWAHLLLAKIEQTAKFPSKYGWSLSHCQNRSTIFLCIGWKGEHNNKHICNISVTSWHYLARSQDRPVPLEFKLVAWKQLPCSTTHIKNVWIVVPMFMSFVYRCVVPLMMIFVYRSLCHRVHIVPSQSRGHVSGRWSMFISNFHRQ